MLIIATKICVCCAVIVATYAAVDRILARHGRFLALRSSLSRRHPLRQVEASVRTLLWTMALVCLCIACLLILGIRPGQLLLARVDNYWLLYGIFGALVGLGDAGLGSLLCFAAISAARASPRRYKFGLLDATARADSAAGGFLTSLLLLPIPVAIITLLVYGAVEEIMLRGVFLVAALGLGPGFAFAIAVTISLVVQAFSATSGTRTLFPFIGTLVSAPVHAMLFLAVPDVRPLIIAQVTALVVRES
jgi:hypothetical protein